MAAVAASGVRRRSLITSLLIALPAIRPHAVKALALAREHITTVAAFSAVDYGAFTAARPAGWITLGVSLLVLDWQIRG